MTDRADELALRVLETCSHGISDYDDNYGPCLRCTADALRAYAEEARREEREACAKQIKSYEAALRALELEEHNAGGNTSV